MRTKLEGRTHPTKVKLLETVVELLDQHPADAITLDQILEMSQISKGSMYHHFADFDDLLELAEVKRFSAYVDLSIYKLTQSIMHSKTTEELREQLHRATLATQNENLTTLRMDRVSALARAGKSGRFLTALGQEQQRLTDGITEIVETGQDRGFIRTELDARAIAILIQAYTLGRVVDDIAEEKVDPEKWIALIDNVADMILVKN
jgi:AcrR family transcriptional regulator